MWTGRGAVWVILVWALFSAGCTPEREAPLRIGTNVWPGYEPLYLARSLGYFDGTPIIMVEYPSSTEVARAFSNGAIEAAALTLDEVLTVVQQDVAARVVLVMDTSYGADVLLGKPYLKNLNDLKGRVVGVESGALGAYVLSRALEIAGLNPADITVRSLPSSDAQQQLYEAGQLDALVTMEPLRTQLMRKGARQLFDSSQIPGEVVDVLVVRQDYLEQHPQQVNDLLSRWFTTLAYRSKNLDDSNRRMSKRLALSPEEVGRSFDGLRIPSLEDNRKLLGGNPPQLLAPAEKLMRTMLAKQLLNKPVALPPLFTTRYLPANAP